MNTQKCSKCNIEKELSMFGTFNCKTKDNVILSYKYRCRECETKIQRERRIRQKEEEPEKYYKKLEDHYNRRKEHKQNIAKEYLSKPENREKRNKYLRKYKADRRLNDHNYKLFENHRKKIWKSLTNKSNSSKELLGCDIENYVNWITYTMSDEMTWDNYGTYWNIDHLVPVNTFDITNPDEAKKAFNWKNTWAMIASKNFSKRIKIIPEELIEHKKVLGKYIIENKIV
jgi:hypothetical protein